VKRGGRAWGVHYDGAAKSPEYNGPNTQLSHDTIQRNAHFVVVTCHSEELMRSEVHVCSAFLGSSSQYIRVLRAS
jgi:hypothetical protein